MYSQLPAPYHAKLEVRALRTARGLCMCRIVNSVRPQMGYEDWHEPCTLRTRRESLSPYWSRESRR